MADLRSRDGLAVIVDAQKRQIDQQQTTIVVLEDALRAAGKSKPNRPDLDVSCRHWGRRR